MVFRNLVRERDREIEKDREREREREGPQTKQVGKKCDLTFTWKT